MVRATGARRMRRRPAAGASTSSAGAAEVEGYWCSVLHIRLLLLLFFFTLLLMCFQAIVFSSYCGIYIFLDWFLPNMGYIKMQRSVSNNC